IFAYVSDVSRRPHHAYAQPVSAVVAISGAAALGKTRLCHAIVDAADHRGMTTTLVELDGFLKNRSERREENLSGYNPRATRFRPLLDTLHTLLFAGQSVDVPTYDHTTGMHGAAVSLAPADLVLLDGIMSLHYEVRDHFISGSIFLQAETELIMKAHRLDVDMRERGYSAVKALAHCEAETREYDRWIHHQVEFADLVVCIAEDRTMTVRTKTM
ncbi:MAG TPA: hypothetical protein VLN59_05135, partial [Burkholderiales bacterium]|nr:hypothetical protein [Burkholderiales bacterium]